MTKMTLEFNSKTQEDEINYKTSTQIHNWLEKGLRLLVASQRAAMHVQVSFSIKATTPT